MARLTLTLIAAAVALGLAPALAGAQTVPVHQGPLILNPSTPFPLAAERSPSLNLEPAQGSGPSGLRFLGSEARISPTLSAPTASEAPISDRPESRVPGFRLKVPW